jgi:hypothetical protein
MTSLTLTFEQECGEGGIHVQPLLHQQLRVGLHNMHSHSIKSVVVLLKKEKRQQKIIRISRISLLRYELYPKRIPLSHAWKNTCRKK